MHKWVRNPCRWDKSRENQGRRASMRNWHGTHGETTKKIISTCTSWHLERFFQAPHETLRLYDTTSRSCSGNGREPQVLFLFISRPFASPVIRVQVNMMMMRMMMAPVRTRRVTVVSSAGEKKGAFQPLGLHTSCLITVSKNIFIYGFTFLLADPMLGGVQVRNPPMRDNLRFKSLLFLLLHNRCTQVCTEILKLPLLGF